MYESHKEKIADLLKNKDYENNDHFYAHPTPEEIQTLTNAMTAFVNVKACWIKAQIRVRPARNPLYEILCANCHMEVEAGMDWDVKCSGCSVVSTMEVRLTIPVALVEGELELRTILRSPDAQKLCPFTAAQIKEHEEQGINVVDEISVAMDNTEVVCFVKHYDKEYGADVVRKYVLLKMYTPDEMLSFSHSTAALADSHAQAESSNHEKQFFSPNTKDVLAEIANETNESSTTTGEQSYAKRAISFGSLTEADIRKTGIYASEEILAKESDSPQKKARATEETLANESDSPQKKARATDQTVPCTFLI